MCLPPTRRRSAIATSTTTSTLKPLCQRLVLSWRSASTTRSPAWPRSSQAHGNRRESPALAGESSTADPAAAPDRLRRGAGQSLMDVYLIPVGPDRYELYCERRRRRDATSSPTSRRTGVSPRMYRELQGRARARRAGAAERRDARARRAAHRGPSA